MIPNVLVIGEPGSGKSVAAARDAVEFRGAAVVLDPHRDSLARLVLEHATGNVLFDCLSDLNHVLGYGLLRPSTHPDLRKRAQQNERRARLFVEVMMRRRGGEIAAAPLMEEWVMALLIGFLNQRTPKPVRIIPFGFLPGTDGFQSFVRGITLPEIRAKFQQLVGLNPRSLRAEVGSATRLVDAVFRSPAFLARCDASFDLGAFLQDGGKLVVERGDENEDVARTIMGGIIQLVTDHCESRPDPWPPVRIYLDECTNARTAGAFEERKAGETRKYQLSWCFLCQHPNFPNGADGFFANCQRKETFRVGHYELARKLAPMYVAGLPAGEESRADRLDAVTRSLMTLQPGWRWVTDRGGPCQEYVPMLESPWPDWPGLREEKLRERLCEIYARPEYRIFDGPSTGDPETPPSSPSSPDTPPRPSSSPAASSPAERWKSRRKNRSSGSLDSDDAGG